MKSNLALIDELCAEVKPVRCLYSPLTRTFIWYPTVLLLSFVFFSITGAFRPNALEQLTSHPRFLLECTVGLIAGLVAAYAAFESMVPGKAWSLQQRFLVLLPAFAFVTLNIYSVFNPAVAVSWVGWRADCASEIMFFGALPMVICFGLALRAAPVDSGWTGLLTGIASFSPAVVGMSLACTYEPMHIIFFHIVPVVLLSMSGRYLGKAFFKV